MQKAFNWALLTTVLASLTACGGGGSAADDGPTTGKTLSAMFAGAYTSEAGSPCGTTAFTDRSFGTIEVRLPSMPDMLAVDAGNIGYRICGNQVWVGQMVGTVTQTIASGTAPLSGNGTLSWTQYASGSGPIGAVSGSGTLLANADSGMVTSIAFSSSVANGPALRFAAANAAGRLTTSYTTLASTFREENFYPLYSTPTGSLTVHTDGTFDGTTSVGSFSGQITAFDARQGVHNVKASVRLAANGQTVQMVGIIAPGETATGGNGNALPGVVVALMGNGTGFVGVYRQ